MGIGGKNQGMGGDVTRDPIQTKSPRKGYGEEFDQVEGGYERENLMTSNLTGQKRKTGKKGGPFGEGQGKDFKKKVGHMGGVPERANRSVGKVAKNQAVDVYQN